MKLYCRLHGKMPRRFLTRLSNGEFACYLCKTSMRSGELTSVKSLRELFPPRRRSKTKSKPLRSSQIMPFDEALRHLAKYKGAGTRRHPSKSLRAALLARGHYSCAWCGASDDLTIDHITPYSKGGRTVPGNLQVLCGECNNAKGDDLAGKPLSTTQDKGNA